jgi:hypothetical protein
MLRPRSVLSQIVKLARLSRRAIEANAYVLIRMLRGGCPDRMKPHYRVRQCLRSKPLFAGGWLSTPNVNSETPQPGRFGRLRY